MSYDEVIEPVPFPVAFDSTDDAALLSQAAILILTGMMLRSDITELLDESDPDGELGVPEISPVDGVIPQQEVRRDLVDRFGIEDFEHDISRLDPETDFSTLASELHDNPNPLIAAKLLEASLWHPRELIRVAAASSYIWSTSEPMTPLRTLARAIDSEDDLVRAIAETTLARLSSRISPPADTPDPIDAVPAPAGGASTSIIVHGTFARNNSWWQPLGDFFEYIDGLPRWSVYSNPDFFSWSGGYSDLARSVGGTDLFNWWNARNLNLESLFAHSHGGSVAMLATQGGLKTDKLILLSCPVHKQKLTLILPMHWGCDIREEKIDQRCCSGANTGLMAYERLLNLELASDTFLSVWAMSAGKMCFPHTRF